MASALPTSREELDKLIREAVDQRVAERLSEVQASLAKLQGAVAQGTANIPDDRATLVVFSGEMDTLFAACTIAAGAASMGMEVSMFFTFWGLTALRRTTTYSGKSVGQMMAAFMLPSSPASVPTSRMNMAGMGPIFFKHLMRQKNVETLPDMVGLLRELGVRLVACEMSMGVMGVTREELLPDIDYGGVATYLGDASRSKITLFI
jgi:peroxiredoxin family protein